eukprot:gene40140-48915_t
MKDNNAFGALSDEARKVKSSDQGSAEVVGATSSNEATASNNVANNESSASNEQDSSWTVQSSSKPRRLVPQFSLTRQDLGTDKSASKAPTATHHGTSSTHHTDAPKKKMVTRFTREELLFRRKEREEKALASLGRFSEIISQARLDPVSFSRLEPEDVLRLWNAHGKEGGGRGRGRGAGGARPVREGEAGDQQPSWARGDGQEERRGGGDPWASPDAGGGDLAALSAAALSFRQQLSGLGDGGEHDAGATEQEDTMVQLLLEQDQKRGGGAQEAADAVPEWAEEPAPPVRVE